MLMTEKLINGKEKMITTELVNYVAAQKKAGVSADKIKQALTAQGWSMDDVTSALKPNAQVMMPVPLPHDPRSGQGDDSPLPPEIKGWSWGAAGLTWIWGIRFRVWLAFLTFAGPLAYIWWIVLGIKGRAWAWQHHRWSSVDQFYASQKTWDRWGVIAFIAGGLLVVGLMIFYAWLITSGIATNTNTVRY